MNNSSKPNFPSEIKSYSNYYDVDQNLGNLIIDIKSIAHSMISKANALSQCEFSILIRENDELKKQIGVLEETVETQNQQIFDLAGPASYYRGLLDVMSENPFLQQEWVNFMTLIKLAGSSEEREILEGSINRKNTK